MEKQEIATTYKTGLAKVNDLYLPMVTEQLESNKIALSEYGKSCVMNAIGAINTILDSAGVAWNDAQLDQSNVTQNLITVASLQLNPAANPRECYFQLRNVSSKGADGKQVWKKKIEFGIEGDGFDALVARFGRDVKKIFPIWLVREDDEFKYPRFVGLDVTPPEWQPKGTGRAVKIVYPIQSTDNSINYYIAEREDVKKNLIAHMSNTMMNMTFGICADRYKATDEQKKKIAEKKKDILDKAKALKIDEILNDVELSEYISPAWKEEQSRESMIIRKMRNNVVKKIPKSFESSLQADVYNETSDETYKEYKEDILVAEKEPLKEISFDVDEETGEVIQNQPEF